MSRKFIKECSKYYRKHWKTPHYLFTKADYLKYLFPMAKATNYKYGLKVMVKMSKLTDYLK